LQAREVVALTPQTLRAVEAVLAADSTVSKPEREAVLEVCRNAEAQRRRPGRELPRFVTPAQTAEILQVNRRTVWRLVQAGKLKRIKLGHKLTRFRLDDIEQIR